LKPQLELVCEKPLGNVAKDKISDVTAERWYFNVQATKPVVSPDGKHVLAVGEAKMTWYDTSSGAQKWEKSTYGGIDSYIIGGDRLYMAEKSVIDRYIGYYQTDGAVIYDCLGSSEDGRVICAATWPTRVGTEKHGEHSLYMLRIK